MMELFVRLVVFGAAMLLGSSAPTHFSQLRVACIAVDVFLPLLASGQALASTIEMEDQKPNLRPLLSAPSETMPHHSSAADASEAQLHSDAAIGADPKENNEEKHGKQSAPHAEHHTDAIASQVSAQNAAALSDLSLHGTHMTMKERKEAEEILRQKYGAIDRK